MPQYLCQLCNTIVTYGENHPNHPCFFYMNNDSVYTTPQLHESDEVDRKNHKTKGKLTINSNDKSGKLYSTLEQSDDEEFLQLNFLLTENNDKAPSVNSSERNLSFSCNEPSNNVQNEKSFAKIQSSEIDSLNTSSKKLEPNYRFESGFIWNHQRVSNSEEVRHQQKKSASNISSVLHVSSNKKRSNSLKERKRQSFNNNKHILTESLEDISKKARLDRENISEMPNFPASPSFSTVTEKSDKDLFEVSWDQTHSSISHEVASVVPSGSGNTVANVMEPLHSMQDANAVAGPSGISKDLLRNFGQRKYQCNLCPKKFTFRSKFDIHYRAHTGEKPFVCHLCGKGFARKHHLEYHSRTHTGEKPFVCNVCNRGFIQKGELKIHALTHTGEKPFVCDVCRRGFIRKGDLKAHALTHTGEKPFVCNVCNRGFTQKGDLKRHALTHTGVKPFVCDICGKGYIKKQHLKFHSLTHTGEKPFVCNVCEKRFSLKYSLKRHVLTHTVEKP